MVASTFSCIGLGAGSREQFGELVARIGAATDVSSTEGGVTLHRWTDPSGAAVDLAIDEHNDLAELIPTLDLADAGIDPGARLGSLEPLAAPMLSAAVHDDGEQVTALGFHTAQYWQLAALPRQDAPPTIDAHVVALGTAMAAFPDVETFMASQGTSRRIDPRSFIPGGLFRTPQTPTALLTGTVLAAERRTNTLTGQDFVVADVRTVGFTATVCLPGSEFPELPVVGGILSGGASMTATLALD